MRWRLQRLGLTFALAGAAASIVACGGGSSVAARGAATSSSSTPRPSPSSAQFIARADTICRRLNGELAATKSSNGTPAGIVQVVPRHIALERNALSELVRLVPPSSIARDWQGILSDRKALADQLEALVRAARRNDDATLKTLVSTKRQAHATLRDAATRIGFKDCAEVG